MNSETIVTSKQIGFYYYHENRWNFLSRCLFETKYTIIEPPFVTMLIEVNIGHEKEFVNYFDGKPMMVAYKPCGILSDVEGTISIIRTSNTIIGKVGECYTNPIHDELVYVTLKLIGKLSPGDGT